MRAISIENCVESIQKGHVELIVTLEETFKPLVYAWLKKIHQLHTNETEDYISMAKIILLESAQTYEPWRGVPFASYYKINLYHWYGNQIRKKKIECITLDDLYMGVTEDEYLDHEENLRLLALGRTELTEQEQDILDRLLKGQSPRDIGDALHLSKKTILNKKYLLIKKMRDAILSDGIEVQ